MSHLRSRSGRMTRTSGQRWRRRPRSGARTSPCLAWRKEVACKRGEGGRKTGSKNKRQPEVADWCRRLVEDATYRKGLQTRLNSGKIAPGVEVMIWAYAYGRPVETHQHVGDG